MSSNRVFSEQEASQILRRAAELMEKAVEGGKDYTPGITRAELENIAKEVGVDPKFLELAITQQGKPESKTGVLRLTEEFERVIDGELDPADFDVIVENIKPLSRIGQSGISQVGRSIQASAWTGISQANVSVSSRNGRTRLKVASNSLMAFLMGGYPALIGSIISAAALSENGYVGYGVAAAAAFLVAGVGAVRALIGKGHAAAAKLTDKLETAIANETVKKTDSSPVASQSGQLEERLEQKA